MTRTFQAPAQLDGVTHGASNDFYVGGAMIWRLALAKQEPGELEVFEEVLHDTLASQAR